MNVKLKFKIWHRDENEMFHMKDIMYINFSDRIIRIENDHYSFSESLDEDVIKILHYTGFKDKNGIEICDGDVLSKDGYWSIRVECNNDGFMVRDLDKIRYNNKCLNWYISNFDINGWEVIGNIYENPDLLEDK